MHAEWRIQVLFIAQKENADLWSRAAALPLRCLVLSGLGIWCPDGLGQSVECMKRWPTASKVVTTTDWALVKPYGW